jgi:hypothetical protein
MMAKKKMDRAGRMPLLDMGRHRNSMRLHPAGSPGNDRWGFAGHLVLNRTAFHRHRRGDRGGAFKENIGH